MSDKTWWAIIIIGVLLVTGYFYFGNEGNNSAGKVTDTVDKVTNAESESAGEALAKDLASEYGATIPDLAGRWYSYQIEDELMKTAPVVFSGEINDIYRSGNSLGVRVTSPLRWESWLSPSVTYDLAGCDEKLLLVSSPKYGYDSRRYLVVAEIDSVRKVALRVSGYSVDDDSVELDYEPSAEFLAKGKCIDIIYIEGTERQP